MLFNPSIHEVRQFFVAAWKKYQTEPLGLAPLEQILVGIIQEHPEYHAWLLQEDALSRKAPEGMQPPFLHLSLHLALQEQITIDQPAGIRACFHRLCQTHTAHEAQHRMMAGLADVIEQAKRTGAWPDSQVYLDTLNRF